MLRNPGPAPWIIAHRGASEEEPENTLRAFRRAVELGADLVELDVHLSRDGQPVVIHDASVGKTTDGHGAVEALALAELRRLDAGRGERIPTLQEVIDALRGRCGLYIELKAPGTPAVVVEAVRRARMSDEVIVGSFQPDLLREVAARAPHVATSLLVGSAVDDPVPAPLAAGAAYAHLCWERRGPNPAALLTPPLLGRLRAAGLGIILWHEERPEVIAALRGVSVDGVCGNRPELLRPLKRFA